MKRRVLNVTSGSNLFFSQWYWSAVPKAMDFDDPVFRILHAKGGPGRSITISGVTGKVWWETLSRSIKN